MEVQPGQKVVYQGSEWLVLDIEHICHRVKLARPAPWMADRDPYSEVSSIRSGMETIVVTVEDLLGEQRGSKPTLRQAENMYAHIVRMQEQGGLNFGNIGNILSDIINQAVGDTQVDANRKAELDATYAEPAAEGWAVLWRGKGSRGPNVQIRFTISGVSMPDDEPPLQLERCASVEDCWTFVDYLKDEEAGKPCAIREDTVVVFFNHGAGWQTLTQEQVPNDYREEQ